MAKNSEDYWRKREEEQRKHNIKDEQEFRKELEKMYRATLKEVNDQIYAFYAKYASQNAITMAEAKRRADKLDIEAYAEKAKRYVKEKNFSEQANKEMRIYNLTMKANRLELLKAEIGLELCANADEIDDFMREELEGRTLNEIERQAGILGKSVQNNRKFAQALVNASFHNATFSDRIWANQALLRNELSNILTTALIQGRNPRDFISQVRKRFDVSTNNAYRLLVTELARVQTSAQMESFKRNGFDQYTFLALGTACEICRKIDGKHFDVDKANAGINMPPMHPNCVLPDTKIIAPDMEAMMKCEYSGDVVEIGTSNGTRLTVTANHIVLTSRGWVRAKNLVEGDKVISYSRWIKSMIKSNPAYNDSIPTIEQLFTSLIESGSVSTSSMPVAAKDLKGDAVPNSKVDIIFVNSKLRHKINLAFNEFVSDILLIGTSKGSKSVLSRKCSLAELLVGTGLAADGIMSGKRIAEILLVGALAHRQLVRLRLPSDYDTRLQQTISDNRSTNTELFSDSVFAYSGNVKRFNEMNVDTVLDRRRSITGIASNSSYSSRGNIENLCDFISCFSGFVELDNITSVIHKFYSGHVYDASSQSTLYIANGIMTSNCRCSTSAYMDDDEYNAWLDSYKDHGVTWDEWKKRYLEQKETTFVSKKDYLGDDMPVQRSVNRSLVNTKKYHDKFENIPIGKKARESIYQTAMKILEHRDGTDYEDIAAINLKTGEVLAFNTSSTRPGISGFTEKEYRKITESKSNIVIVHNHPNNSRLSYKDLQTLFQYDYVRMEIAICHNGDIAFAYDPVRNFDIEAFYQKAYNTYKEVYGKKQSELFAKDKLYDSDTFKYERR